MTADKKMYSMELPVDLVERIDRQAKTHRRSRQAEIAVALEEYLKKHEGKKCSKETREN